jgi:hypothetical protein
MFEYAISNKELIIKKDGVVIWQGKPNGCSVSSVLGITNNQDCIVLCELEETSPKVFGNLFRFSPQGHVVWIAKMPEIVAESDYYVQMEMDGNELVANSWTAFRVQIDIRNGHILKRVFTK